MITELTQALDSTTDLNSDEVESFLTKIIRLKVTTIVVLFAKIYENNIWKIHGIPKKILSNRGSQFASQFMEDLYKILRIRRMSIVYNPQTDGQIERINQEAKVFLQYYVNYQQDNWTEWLLAVEFQLL